MATFSVSISTIKTTRTALDSDAQRAIDGFLQSWCADNDINYDILSAQSRLDMYVKILIDQTIDISTQWYKRQATIAALGGVVVDPVIFD